MGQFLLRIKEGDIPGGSIIIIENFDRLSRESVDKASERLRDIVLSGVKVLTLDDNQLYDEDSVNDPVKLIISILQHERSHQESARKAEILRAVWDQKRADLKNNKLYTKQTPAWLRVNEEGELEHISERVELIKELYEHYRNGHGFGSIAKMLNKRGEPVWNTHIKEDKAGNRLWNISSIRHLLFHRSLLGEFQPHEVRHTEEYDDSGDFVRIKRIREPVGEPLLIFPPVVSPEEFAEIERMLRKKMEGKRKRGGRTGKMTSLFTHIGVCGHCGGSFTVENKGGKSGGIYLNCSTARLKAKNKRDEECKVTSFNYPLFEKAFLDFITELDVKKILKGGGDNEELKKLK